MPFMLIDPNTLTSANIRKGTVPDVKLYIRWLRQELTLAETALRQWESVPPAPAPPKPQTDSPKHPGWLTRKQTAARIDKFFTESAGTQAYSGADVGRRSGVAYSAACKYLRECEKSGKYLNTGTPATPRWRNKPKPPEPANAPAS